MRENLKKMENELVDCLKTIYGIKIKELKPLDLGADMDALIFKAEASNGGAYFLKIKHINASDISPSIVTWLSDEGIQHVVPVIKTIAGATFHLVNGCTLTVSQFIEGWNGFSRNLTIDQWQTLGQVMKRIHALKVPDHIQSKVRVERYAPIWRETVRSLYPLIDSGMDADETATDILKFMKINLKVIDRLVVRSEQLAQIIQDQRVEYVFCHSDLHAGNILIDKNGTIQIVDWDNPILAPKERDLMFIGGGVANVWNKAQEVDLFYAGYGDVEINWALLTYYRYERILEDIADYGRQLLLVKEGSQNKIKWVKEFKDQFASNGVIDIAFETDRQLLSKLTYR